MKIKLPKTPLFEIQKVDLFAKKSIYSKKSTFGNPKSRLFGTPSKKSLFRSPPEKSTSWPPLKTWLFPKSPLIRQKLDLFVKKTPLFEIQKIYLFAKKSTYSKKSTFWRIPKLDFLAHPLKSHFFAHPPKSRLFGLPPKNLTFSKNSTYSPKTRLIR